MESVNSSRSSDDMQLYNKKLSWNELKVIVNDLRRELATISSSLPMQISFRRLNENTTRVYYLVTTPDWGVPLLYIDVPHNAKTSTCISSVPRLLGRPGMDCLPEGGARRSRQQRLLSERQRAPSWGALTSYQLHPTQPCIALPVHGSLYTLKQMEGWSVPQVLNTGGAAALTPAMCPKRADVIAYAADSDIWLTGACRKPIRMTYACLGSLRLADDPRQAGVPSYVMQEEFSRYTGFWWQPQTNDNVYRILYEEVDESAVKICSFPSYNSHNGETEEFRFPRAGSANAKSTLRLLEFTIEAEPPTEADNSSPGSDNLSDQWDTDNEMHGEPLEPQWCVRSFQWLDLQRSLEDVFPWMEYIARVGWGPTPQYVWCQILDRRQQRLELVLIPLEAWGEPIRYPLAPTTLPSPAHQPQPWQAWQPVQVLVLEHSRDAWVNVHDILHFLLQTDPSRVSFIWASEETGHLHLYLITSGLQGKDGVVGGLSSGPNIISKVALTRGKWEVIGKKIWVDENRGLVYFVGLKETPLERHLYCSSYREPHPDTPHLLTQPGSSYTIDMDQSCSVVVGTHSNIRTLPVCVVYLVQHIQGSAPRLAPAGTLAAGSGAVGGAAAAAGVGGSGYQMDGICPWTSNTPLAEAQLYRQPGNGGKERARYTVELHSTRLEGGTGEELHAMVFRPSGEPRTPRPTLLYVYGGPVVQTVTNTFKSMRQLRMHLVAARGYCVVCIDSRGSKHRGVEFEARIRGKMGTVELEDQIEVLKWLAEETGCIDLTRVAVHGWSYGGYLSLMALAQRPDVFKVCVACAPVTSWEMYDTAYTERYMDLPQLNPTAYARGSVVKQADKFPDEENRLLIVHGLQDENVHFLHTQQLIDALVKAGKPYQLQVYPNERHSLRHLEASAHYEATLLCFLQNYL